MRSAKDVYMVYAMSDPSLATLSSKLIALAAAGMAFAEWENQASSHAAEEKAAFLLAHPDFVTWLGDALSGPDKEVRWLRRASVVAAMYKTWSKAPEKATAFWAEVKGGTSPDPNAPSRVLQRWLMGTSILSGSSSGKSSKTLAGLHEMMVRCLHGWNAWRRNEKTRLNYFADKPTPEVA
jgi:hypothetical protein